REKVEAAYVLLGENAVERGGRHLHAAYHRVGRQRPRTRGEKRVLGDGEIGYAAHAIGDEGVDEPGARPEAGIVGRVLHVRVDGDTVPRAVVLEEVGRAVVAIVARTNVDKRAAPGVVEEVAHDELL